mgnify:CR=1 FL=1
MVSLDTADTAQLGLIGHSTAWSHWTQHSMVSLDTVDTALLGRIGRRTARSPCTYCTQLRLVATATRQERRCMLSEDTTA